MSAFSHSRAGNKFVLGSGLYKTLRWGDRPSHRKRQSFDDPKTHVHELIIIIIINNDDNFIKTSQ